MTLTSEELQALIQLVNRIPLTQAEALWVREIIARLSQLGEGQNGDTGTEQHAETLEDQA